MDLNVLCFVNQLGYGIASWNILKALVNADVAVALWPLGPAEMAVADRPLFASMLGCASHYNDTAPCLRIYHPHDMSLRAGRGTFAGFPIFELDRFTDLEKHHLGQLDVFFTTSEWGKKVLEDNGMPPEHIYVAPLGVDAQVFSPQPMNA